MKGQPRSLVTRMTWLVVAVSVFSLLLHLAVSWLWANEVSEDLVDSLSGRVILARQILERAPPEQRSALAQSISQIRFTVERLQTPALVSADIPPFLPGQVLQRIRDAAGPAFNVHLGSTSFAQSRGIIQFDFELDNEHWRVTYRVQPPLLAVLGTGIGWLVLIAVGVLLSLVMGVRSIARPMSQLARRLANQGGALQPLSMPVGGGAEISTVVTAFNQLVVEVQRADQIKQQMLAGVSHDLRTPLARLRLRIETQCDELIAQELTADLFAVERIVSQFLAYVQGQSKAALGKPEAVMDVVSWVVSGYAEQGSKVEFVPCALRLELPDLAVQRALANLIDNALSHGMAPVLVALSFVCRDEHGRGVLTVWDHGTGMSDAEFERAQLPFVRLEGSRAGLGHCGLGLAIVAQIAHQLGGHLERSKSADGRFGVSIVWPLFGDTDNRMAP
jgi:two-component system, OmpR family, osmolarity sensor histidine kinase EnvZ